MKTWLVVALLLLSPATIAGQSCPPGSTNCPSPTAPVRAKSPSLSYLFRVGMGNPAPWSTAVRITSSQGKVLGTGSGTVIDGRSDSALVMTCAHILRLDPSATLTVEIFGPGLVASPANSVGPAIARFAGVALDRDDSHDVGLVRFRPGRALPASPLVPPGWSPSGEPLCSVGCSNGANPTGLATRYLRDMRGSGLIQAYHGYECEGETPSGRSGGGLFDEHGRLAGVCDFADTKAYTGIYARAESLRAILRRNGLVELADGSPAPAPGNGFSLQIGGRKAAPIPAPAVPAPASAPDASAETELERVPNRVLSYVGTAVAGGAAVAVPALLAWFWSRARAVIPPRLLPGSAPTSQAPAPAAAESNDLIEVVGLLRRHIDASDSADAKRAETEARVKRDGELLEKIRALLKEDAPPVPKDG